MSTDERWLLEEKYGGVKTSAFMADCKRLATGEPVAYVIGHQPFLGLTIHLDSRPLIPRPETEWWAEQLLAAVGRRQEQAAQNHTCCELSFLDLCAGSGAIGCAALKALPYMVVSFGEIDPIHAGTIEKNIRENHLDASRARVCIGDVFAPFEGQQFDVIACNPPYIPADRVLPESVSTYEPSAALYSGEDGLSLIRRIAKDLPRFLKKQGVAWIECDSAHAPAARALFAAEGMRSEIHTDQYGAERFLVVSFP